MAPRGFWKGTLKLSLVTCPVAMTPATSEGDKVRFHTLNRTTGNRVESRYVDAQSGAQVEDDEQARAYQQDEDHFVVLEDEDLDAIALKTTRIIDIEMFVPRGSIEWLWYDRPHYLIPDDAVGAEAFSVIRAAMEMTDTVGISRLVLYRRERAVLLEPRDNGIVLWTLRYGDEVRPPSQYFSDTGTKAVEPDVLSLVVSLIGKRTRDWNGTMVHDPVQENLQAIIADKQKGRKPERPKAKAAEPAGNVVSIVDALRKSIAAEQSGAGRKR